MKKTSYIFLIIWTFISCTGKRKENIKYKTESRDVLFFENSGIKNEQAREIFVEGLKYIEIENFESAKKKFIESDEIESKNPTILNAISQAEIRLGNAQKSNEILFKTLMIDSTYLPTYINLGQNYMQLRDYEKAKEILLKGRKFATDKNLHMKSVLFLNLSIAFNNLGNFKKGLKYSAEVIEISQDKKLTDFASKVKEQSEEGLLRQNPL